MIIEIKTLYLNVSAGLLIFLAVLLLSQIEKILFLFVLDCFREEIR